MSDQISTLKSEVKTLTEQAAELDRKKDAIVNAIEAAFAKVDLQYPDSEGKTEEQVAEDERVYEENVSELEGLAADTAYSLGLSWTGSWTGDGVEFWLPSTC